MTMFLSLAVLTIVGWIAKPEAYPLWIMCVLALAVAVWDMKWKSMLSWLSNKTYAKVAVLKYKRK